MKTRKIYIQVLITLFLLLVLCPNGLPAQGRNIPVSAKNGMVVSASEISSNIGRDILQKGGNSIDAAVATAFSLAVTCPWAGNIGGGGFLVYHRVDGMVTTIDFREKAPLAAGKRMYLDDSGSIKENSNHEGFLSIGVPGTVAGLYRAHSLYGNLPWPDLLDPAIELAEKGFPVTWGIHFRLEDPYSKKRLLAYESSVKTYFDADLNLLEPGYLWKQPELAETLKRIREKGHDGFYRGETAKKLSEFMLKKGGIITAEDLRKYEAIERKPVHGTYRGYDIYSMPPPSSGGVAIIEILNILEGYDLKAAGHNSALYIHLLTEAMKRAFADRAEYLGDPDFNPNMPLEKLISKEHAAELRKSINPKTASKSDPARFNSVYESEETTHFSVIDKKGNAVSLTYTLEQSFGSGIIAEGLGFLLNNEMGDFNAIPGLTDTNGRIGTEPNRIAPEKRMLSSMSPTIVSRDGKVMLVIGSPGGRTIINTVLQIILNHVDHNMNIADAIGAGRFHHQWLPDVTDIEKGAISRDTEKIYTGMGHRIRYRESQGRAMGIHYDHKKNLISGAADPRSYDGAAIGY
ncbi:gamma-glutamyltransferase [Thermodesulfobacteriota bacterium]